jgi:WD40 repeat protein
VTALVALVNWQGAESERRIAEHAAATSAARLALAEGQRAATDDPSLGLRLVAEGLDRATRAGIDTAPFREELIRELQTGRYAKLGAEVATFDIVGGGSAILVDNATGNGRLVQPRDAAVLAELPGPIDLDRPGSSIPDTIEDDSATLFPARYEDRPGVELRHVNDGSLVELADVADKIDFVGDRVVVWYPVGELPFNVPFNPADNSDEVYPGPWTADVRSGTDGSLIASIEQPFTDLHIVDGESWGSAFIERQGEVALIDLNDGQEIETWSGFGSSFFEMDEHFTALTTTAGHCLVVGARDGETRLDLTGPCQFFTISNDNTVLAAASLGGDTQVLRAADREPSATLPAGVTSLQFSPEPGASRILLIDAEHRVKLIETASGRLVSDFGGVIAPTGTDDIALPAPVAFSPNGTRVILNAEDADGNSGARVFDSVTGRQITLGSQFYVPGENEQTPFDVSFSADDEGTYMIASYGDREELLRSDGSVVPIAGISGGIYPWPDGAGPILVAHYSDGDELIDWDTGASMGRLPVTATDGWAFRPAPRAAAITTNEYDDVEKQDHVVIVSADGTWVENPGWKFTSFSPDPEASTLVVERANGAFEVWDRATERLLARLGIGVTYVDFTPDGSILAVRYVTGELYLVAVAALRAMPSVDSIADQDLVELACTGGVGSPVSESRLQAVMGDRPVSCQ